MKLKQAYTRTVFTDERGGVAVMFALMLIPLIGFVGIAVDSSRAYNTRQKLQFALDAAAVAGMKQYNTVSGGTEEEKRAQRRTIMQNYFDANWQAGYNGAAPPVALTVDYDNPDNKMVVSTSTQVPTTLAKVLGVEHLNIGVSSGVSGSSESKIEVAVALDNTSSMLIRVDGVRRVDAMKDAAKNFVNALYTDDGGLQDRIDNMYLSVVPFTSMVNVGSQNSHFLADGSTEGILWDYPKNSTSQNRWRGCVFERSFYNEGGYRGNDLTDAPPDVEKYWPYHVVPSAGELMTACKAAPTVATVTRTEHVTHCYGDRPIVPCPSCYMDGVQVACPDASRICYGTAPEVPCGGPHSSTWVDTNSTTTTSTRVVPYPATPSARTADTSSSGLPACMITDPDQPPSVTHGLTNVGPYSTYWTNYEIYQPYATYVDVNGLIYFHPPNSPTLEGYGVHSLTWNRTIPTLRNNSGDKTKNVDTHQSICCYGSNNTTTVQGVGAWVQTGRWIKPYSVAGSVKFGGWGNSGCGLPITPLTENREDIINAIDEIEVVNEVERGVPSYQGTIIQQGLAWGWRTLSPRWRGEWKDRSGGAIDARLPLDLGSGSIKAVVVLTDGLNFLPDPLAYHGGYGSASWFALQGTTINLRCDNNIEFYGNCGNMTLSGYDSSAYGLLANRQNPYAKNPATGLYPGVDPPSDARYQMCRLRQAAMTAAAAEGRASDVSEPTLETWKCREYDCMLRDAAGTCMTSSIGANYWGPRDADAALYGPYFDELQRRMSTTCQNLKASGVRPYFILFDVETSSKKDDTLRKLQACAGINSVFDAQNLAALRAAFGSISAEIKQLRLTK